MKEWLRIALSREVVLRALKYGVVVGTVLIVINHGNAILSGELDSTRIWQMMLTVLVPYCVSTASSCGAILDTRSGD